MLASLRPARSCSQGPRSPPHRDRRPHLPAGRLEKLTPIDVKEMGM